MIKSFSYYESKEDGGYVMMISYTNLMEVKIYGFLSNDFKEENRIQVVTNKSVLRKLMN